MSQLILDDEIRYHIYFRAFFSYFDENRCRWEREKDVCDDSFVDSDVTISDGTDLDTSPDGIDNTGANTTEASSNTDAEQEVSDPAVGNDADLTDSPNDTTEKPVDQHHQCEPLDDNWTCSSGSKQQSLCFKSCTVGEDLIFIIIAFIGPSIRLFDDGPIFV